MLSNEYRSTCRWFYKKSILKTPCQAYLYISFVLLTHPNHTFSVWKIMGIQVLP